MVSERPQDRVQHPFANHFETGEQKDHRKDVFPMARTQFPRSLQTTNDASWWYFYHNDGIRMVRG